MGIERRQLLPVGTSLPSTTTTGNSNTETSKAANTPTTTSTSSTSTTSTTPTTTQTTPTTTNTPTTTQNNNTPTTTTTPTTANNSPTTTNTPTTTSTTATTPRTTSSSSTSTQQQQTQQQQTTPPAQNENTTPAQRGPTTVTSTQAGAHLSPLSSSTLPSATSDKSESGGSHVGSILGTVAGVVGGIVAICVIAGFLMRRWRAKRDREEAEAASAFDPVDFRKSAMLLHDGASDRSPRPPSIIERRLAVNPMSSYGVAGYGAAAGGYGQYGNGYGQGLGPAQGGYDRGSFYESPDQYAQQYIPPPTSFSPMTSDPLFAPPISPSRTGTPALGTPGTPAPSSMYGADPHGPGASSSMYTAVADAHAHSPISESPTQTQSMLSPGLYVPGTQQQSQDTALNRLSTASSILMNPFDSVAFGDGPVDMKRQASFDSMPSTPTTPAQGLESFMKGEASASETKTDGGKHVSTNGSFIDSYGHY
ncbi:hypothetical protein PQX77_000924 [Marasmius sp. AFHP31]|nr:hypothetical protein PQX77_000924 [Marasmius sp. AFHP31]